MKSIEESIETLTKAIMAEAKSETSQIVADAEAQAAKIRKQGQEKAEEIRRETLGKAHSEGERLRGQAMASAQLKARSAQFQRREALLDEVFAQARERLATLQESPDYAEIARRLVEEAVRTVGTRQVRIQMDEQTAQMLGESGLQAIRESTGFEIIAGPALSKGLGVVASSADGRLQFDNTLEKRLHLMMNSLRSPVYSLLSGEKL